MKKISLPAGKYFFGDVAIILSGHDPAREFWYDVCHQTTRKNLPNQTGKIHDISMVGFCELGDDTYYEKGGWEYTVDSGMIFLTNMDDLARKGIEIIEDKLWHGKVMIAREPLEVTMDDEWIVINGEKRIDTKNPAERWKNG
jgi:hypothetical protein